MSIRREKFLRFPGGKAKALTLSYDDGMRQDARMIDILRPAGIKCTFNINGGMFFDEEKEYPEGKIYTRMKRSDALKVYTDDVCEVAVHGYNHTFLPDMDPAQMCCEIVDDRRALEAVFGRQIHGMAYPYGTTSETVCKVLELCGIYYSRTTKSTEKFSLPETEADWLRLPATCHHKNPNLEELCDRFIALTPKRHPQMFYLWGHTYEFDESNNWNLIEDFAGKMKGHEDIWYATNTEIYQCWKDFQALETSADGARVCNPSLRSVWFTTFKGVLYEVKPGQTVIIE